MLLPLLPWEEQTIRLACVCCSFSCLSSLYCFLFSLCNGCITPPEHCSAEHRFVKHRSAVHHSAESYPNAIPFNEGRHRERGRYLSRTTPKHPQRGKKRYRRREKKKEKRKGTVTRKGLFLLQTRGKPLPVLSDGHSKSAWKGGSYGGKEILLAQIDGDIF